MPTRKDRVTPRIWAENGWIKCKVPYSPNYVADLKATISWKLRQWSPSEKVWMVDPSCLDEAIEVAKRHFPNTVIMNGSPDATAAAGPVERDPLEDGTYGTMANLLRAASNDGVKRVYKALAADLHPDRGGDSDTMRRLNTAWDRIRMERGMK